MVFLIGTISLTAVQRSGHIISYICPYINNKTKKTLSMILLQGLELHHQVWMRKRAAKLFVTVVKYVKDH